MKAKYLIKGLIKSIPGIEYLYHFNKETGGSCNARYCYSVWLRHLIFAYQSGLHAIPKVIAEIGPGDTLGVGMAALICGSEKYYALDIARYSSIEENLKVFDELVALFKQKTNIPNATEFPRVRPLLESYLFPGHIFDEKLLDTALNEKRIATIRSAIQNLNHPKSGDSPSCIEYIVPWNNTRRIGRGTVDMIISQAVLQAVDNLDETYKMMSQWLKPDGIQSHDIGFKSCGSADTWYGHWAYSDLEWKIVRGRKNFFINREPYSTHVGFLKKNDLEIITEKKEPAKSIIKREHLAKRFKGFSNEDISTYSVFLQLKKAAQIPKHQSKTS